MEFKLKHKTTMQVADMLGPEPSRSQRRNKTMLRNYKINKDGSYDLSSISQNQRQIKTLVQTKIEQLHTKMKGFFTHQRKNHLQQIAPQMQQLKDTICQLKQQLNRPKSMQQVEEQEHGLLKKKTILLKEIEEINKRLKQNKNHCFHMKLQSEQLDRELNNGKATIQKYKKKLAHIQQSSTREETINNDTDAYFLNKSRRQKNKTNEETQNMQTILNDSLCNEIQNKTKQNQRYSQNLNQKSQQSTYHQSDHVHITQVSNLDHQTSKNKLPLILPHQKIKSPTYYTNISHPETLNCTFKGVNSARYTQTPQLLKKNVHKKQTQINQTFNNQLTQILKNNIENSNTSFDQYLRKNPLDNGHNTSKIGISKHYNGNLASNKRYPLDFYHQINKYEQFASKQKWSKVQSLFVQLEKITPKTCIQPQTLHKNVNHEKDINHVYTTNIQELLMQELRKEQFSSYKQKGYHQGLKDKTHQIKIEIKRIFMNFSSDQFFSEVISKKPIKKQLALILQNCLQ